MRVVCTVFNVCQQSIHPAAIGTEYSKNKRYEYVPQYKLPGTVYCCFIVSVHYVILSSNLK